MNVHVFDTGAIEWTEHPDFKGLFIKVLESRATHPGASVTLTRLAAGQSIGTHTHAVETETIYVLRGRARLVVDQGETIVETGGGATIPCGLPHSLHNHGDTDVELIALHIPPVR